MSPTETTLWFRLRNRELGGIKFRRQVVVGPFIADFYCAQARLIIEIDGESHSADPQYDLDRTLWLEDHSYRVIRFTNADVQENLPGVWEAIRAACERYSG